MLGYVARYGLISLMWHWCVHMYLSLSMCWESLGYIWIWAMWWLPGHWDSWTNINLANGSHSWLGSWRSAIWGSYSLDTKSVYSLGKVKGVANRKCWVTSVWHLSKDALARSARFLQDSCKILQDLARSRKILQDPAGMQEKRTCSWKILQERFYWDVAKHAIHTHLFVCVCWYASVILNYTIYISWISFCDLYLAGWFRRK